MVDRTISSSVFRVTYHSLSEAVVVTVLGRAIGVWTPVGEMVSTMPPVTSVTASPSLAMPLPAAGPERRESNGSETGTLTTAAGSGMTQAQRDKVLAKIRKG